MAKKIFTGRLGGKRPRGCRRQRRVDRVMSDLSEISQGTKIEDRARWTGVSGAVKSLNVNAENKNKKIGKIRHALIFFFLLF